MNNWTSLRLKGCWTVLVPSLQYLPGWRRKNKATQVRSMILMFLAVVPWVAVSKAWISLTGGGAHSCWRRIFLPIGCELASQTKVELPHAVVAGVVGPHGCEYFTDRVEVLLDQSLLDKLPLRRQKTSMDALGENLDEGDWVLNVLEVGGDFQPAVETPSLALGGGIFRECGCREPLGDFLLCSMVVSCCLHPDGRGGRRQGLICGKFVHK